MRIAALTLLGATLCPLSAAIAAELCPIEPWRCEKIDGAWRCDGVPVAASDPSDDALAAAQLTGERLEGVEGKTVTLTGNARATRGSQTLQAARIDYDIEAATAKATDAQYDDARHQFYADEVRTQQDEQRTELDNVRYAIKARRGQGRAQSAVAQGNTTALKNVTYTTCPGEDPSWQIEAAALDIDHEAGQAKAQDFKLRVGGVPVLYAPFATFPIDDRRKSGFLAPKIGGGSDGLDFAVPYYFNLAPNYDATATPRFIADRGVQIGGEFRYLTRQGAGQWEAEFLPDDDRYGASRERARIRHNGLLFPRLRLDADVQYVSDDRYFVDLGDSLNASSQSVLGSIVQLSGAGRNWQASALVDDYELILPDIDESLQTDPYRRVPRVYGSFGERRGNWRYGVSAEWVRFDRDAPCLQFAAGACVRNDLEGGARSDIVPYVGYRWQQPGAFVDTGIKWRYTRHDLDRPRGAARFDASRSRSTPIANIDAGLIFERDRAFGEFRQTLEPRLYYLYVPERDQADTPIFDSAPFDFSYAQLFRDNRFTGGDRQSNANQLTLGVASRLLDGNGVERAAVQVGQIRYFETPTVFLPGDPDPVLAPDRQSSAYVLEWRGRLSDTMSLSGAYRYDPERNRRDLAAVRWQRTFGDGGLVNIGYRYRPDTASAFDPLAAFGPAGIEQAEFSTLVPINDNWRAIARWNYSLREDTTLEAVAGFEYSSCCYSVRLLSRNYLRGVGTERRNAVFLEFELSGLGRIGRDTGEFLRRAILGYQP